MSRSETRFVLADIEWRDFRYPAIVALLRELLPISRKARTE